MTPQEKVQSLLTEAGNLTDEEKQILLKQLRRKPQTGMRADYGVGQELLVLPADSEQAKIFVRNNPSGPQKLTYVWAAGLQKLTLVGMPPGSETWPKKQVKKKANA